MKIGVLSDAHGNEIALNLCLNYLMKNDVDALFFLGDAIGYLPNGFGVIELLKKHSVLCVMGNHEAMLLGRLPLSETKDRVYRIKKNKSILTNEQKKIISEWPVFLQKNIAGREIMFVHGSPHDYLKGYVYPDTDISDYAKLKLDVIFMGNSHYPFISNLGNLLVVNVGSCGLSRDEGSLASCAIYDTESHTCQIKRLSFDVGKVIEKYKNDIDISVIQCLLRKSEKKVFGDMVTEWIINDE